MRRTVSILFVLLGLMAGGCATSAMKGTPFFTGEYEKRIGTPEDRVNMWPLLYYRDPALSVLWPLMELTDKHLAVRPVMSIHGLDEEKKIYNVLWPLGQINQKTGDHRLFPVFWGENYCNVFPLYWYDRDERNRTFLSLPYSYSRGGRKEWDCAFPLFYREKSPGGSMFISPLYLAGADNSADSEWSCLAPLYYRGRKGDREIFGTLAGGWAKDGDSRGWAVVPALSWGSYSSDRGSFVAGGILGHRSWDGENRSSHILPLYYRRKSADKNLFVSLPYSAGSTENTFWRLVPPLYYGSENSKMKTFITPLYAHGRALTDDAYWSALMPFYYSDPAEGRFYSIPYVSKKKNGCVQRIFPPLLSGYSQRGDEKKLTLLAGLSGHEWNGEESSGYTLPLYSYGKDYFLTPLVGWKKGEDKGFVYPLTPLLGIRTGEDTGGWLFPLFSYRRDKNDNVKGSYLWGGFWKNKRNSGSGIFPVYSYKNYGPIEDPVKVTKGYRAAGKEFLSLPFCWYKNKVYTYPVYEEGRRTDKVRRTAQKGNGFFPVWSYRSRKNLENGRVDSGGSLLLWLFDSKYEKRPGRDYEYSRKRVLWRLYHYERLNDDVSVDVFPFITYDKREDGRKSFSFLWRLFSYQKKKDGLKVHVLFIPFGKGK